MQASPESPEAPEDDMQASPEAAEDDMQASPEAAEDDMQASPEAPEDDMQASPEAPEDDMQASPEEPEDDMQASPEEPEDDMQASPEAPEDDMQASPEAPEDDMQTSPEAPEDDMQASPEAAEDDMQASPEADEDDMQASPEAAEGDNGQHEELPEDALATSSAPQPSADIMELDDAYDEDVGDEPLSPPQTDIANTTGDQDESVVNQIFTNRWVTVTEEEMHVWNTVAALPLHYPKCTTLMADLTNDTTPAHEALATTTDLPTLAEYLTAQGVPYSDINMLCIAADQKVASESLSYGKLSLLLISCDPEEGKGLVPHCETFLKELSDGTLLKHQQPLAFTALALSASVAYPDECFCYCVPEAAIAAFQELAVDDIFILNALTPLKASVLQDGQFILRIIGLPKVIELATTDEGEDTMVLSQWYARLRVSEQGADALTAHFVENVCDDEFQDFLSGYIERLIEDENRLDKKQSDD
ncbi:hypothetical protein, conserved [Leishmania tarentolae]|uniref:Uncharacterized protein n=1 Tax=Leishmania tarentolae TaxID=5689 RepID=A0A640KUF1_LEITA|nr:hypothetical protein, conserved [Leishmania tarentolae]